MKENVSFVGCMPTVKVSDNRPDERELYQKLWEKEEYRQVAPGERCAIEFLRQAQPKKGSAVIDLGCGTGRGGLVLAVLGGLDVTFLDFTDNCLDENIRSIVITGSHALPLVDGNIVEKVPIAGELKFVQADLTKRLPIASEYGFCTDVMEHIAPNNINAVLDNCLLACKHIFFQIATTEDAFGKLIGHPLHLSTHPYEWWLERFRERECVIHWSQNNGNSCQFYVTAWVNGEMVVEHGHLNATEETVRKNVKFNISNGWEQVVPHPTNETDVMILGGGWSLPLFEEEIKQRRAEGVKLITLNGTYKWCLERGLIPSALIMVDSREFNARFSKPVISGCKYLIASQCHPSVLEGLPKDRTFLWHTSADLIGDLLTEQYGTWWPVPGGSTALLRAIPLLRMLGFKNFHLYGCDSCVAENPSIEYIEEVEAFRKGHLAGEPVFKMEYKHHAYAQSENDSEMIFPIIANPSGRVFYGHAWMISQAQEFMDLIKFLGEEINLAIYGDGLLNHIIQTGANLSEKEN